MSENPSELQRFYAETVEPLVAYDEQYETDLVRTLETFLEADGNVAGTAQRLFTHRHTIYYRLERVRELSGLDVSSSDGREKLSLGLKAMRVLGIASGRRPRLGGRRRGRARAAPLGPALLSASSDDAELDRVGRAVPARAAARTARPASRATPASRNSPARMISRCGGEAIQAATMCAGRRVAARAPADVLPDDEAARRGPGSGSTAIERQRRLPGGPDVGEVVRVHHVRRPGWRRPPAVRGWRAAGAGGGRRAPG